MHDKKVWLIVKDLFEQRRLSLVCSSLGMIPDIVQASRIQGELEDVDIIVSENQLDHPEVHWHKRPELDAPFNGTLIQGLIVQPQISGINLEESLAYLTAVRLHPDFRFFSVHRIRKAVAKGVQWVY